MARKGFAIAPRALILTRPREAAHRFARDARGAGVTGPILFSPVLRIVPLVPDDIPEGALVLTSEAGARRAHALGLVSRRAWAVGSRTAQVARALGFACETGPGDADGLARTILERERAAVVHLHGRHVAQALAPRLAAAGMRAEGRVVYDQVAQPLSEAARLRMTLGPAILPLFSARSARLVAGALGDAPAPSLVALAISRAVAEAWPFETPLHVAERPDAEAMTAALVRLVARDAER